MMSMSMSVSISSLSVPNNTNTHNQWEWEEIKEKLCIVYEQDTSWVLGLQSKVKSQEEAEKK